MTKVAANSSADFLRYVASVQERLNAISKQKRTVTELHVDLAVAQTHLNSADKLIQELESLVALQRDTLDKVRGLYEDASQSAAIAVIDRAIASIEKIQAQAASARAQKLADHGKKFSSGGRGPGALRKLISHVMQGSLQSASTKQLWEACKSSKRAKKLGIEFYESEVWIDGNGSVGYPRFGNLCSEIRKERRDEAPASRNGEPVKR